MGDGTIIAALNSMADPHSAAGMARFEAFLPLIRQYAITALRGLTGDKTQSRIKR